MAGNRPAAEAVTNPFQKQGIYVIQDMTAGKAYVGSSINLSKRLKQHEIDLKRDDHSNWQLQRAFKKQHDLHVVVIPVAEGHDVRQIEQQLIDEYFNSGLLYNISRDTTAPTQGMKFSEEIRKKMSKAHIGFRHTDESKAKMSTALQGKQHSDEFKEKCRQRMLGNIPSEETRQKLSEVGFGRKHTDESRQKMSDIRKGVKLSEDHANKVRQHLQTYVSDKSISVTIGGVEYPSMLEASRSTGIPKSTLQARVVKLGRVL